jgi:hypothetical protein
MTLRGIKRNHPQRRWMGRRSSEPLENKLHDQNSTRKATKTNHVPVDSNDAWPVLGRKPKNILSIATYPLSLDKTEGGKCSRETATPLGRRHSLCNGPLSVCRKVPSSENERVKTRASVVMHSNCSQPLVIFVSTGVCSH